jgi:hypothetical protein
VHKHRRHPIIDLRFWSWKSLRYQNNAFNKNIASHNQLRRDLWFSS